MEPDINLDKYEVLTASIELGNNNNNPEQYLLLTNAIIYIMKVKDLKNALRARNLNTGGLKAVLITRLKQYVSNGMTAVAYIDPAVLANINGNKIQTLDALGDIDSRRNFHH